MAVVDDHTLLLGPANSVRILLDKPANPDGPLQEAARLANRNAPVAIGVSVASLPDIPRDRLPPQLVGLLAAKLLTATIEIAKEPRVNLSLQFTSADEAIEGEKAARAGIEINALAQAGLFTNQIPAFQAAPAVYAQRAYLQTFARATANARKYVILATNTHDVIVFDLQESIARDMLSLKVPPPSPAPK